jgi:hypothetical protein
MPKPIHEMSSWSPSSQVRTDEEEAWEATRQVGQQTQLVGSEEDYLSETARDVGRHIGSGQWELFVVCDPGEAMHLQFEHLHPEYIAIHDIATQSSRRLLAGLAAATKSPVHKLMIRRRGHGVPLATLEFVELPTGGAPLRLYTTEADADTQSRHDLARVLLAHSRLGVVMVGDLPPHALEPSLQPLRDAMAHGPWPNRHLLLLPLSAAGALTAQAAQMAGRTGVSVRTTPQVTRPADAWNFIAASWNKLREQMAPSGVVLPMIGGAAPSPRPAPVTPLPMKPMPEVPKAASRPAPPPDPSSALAAYVQRVAELKGVVSCCVFEVGTQKPLAHAGSRPGPATLASQGAALFAAMLDAGNRMGLPHGQPDAAITLASHHLLLRPLPEQPGLALHAVLDRAGANLTLARLQLARLDETLEPAKE